MAPDPETGVSSAYAAVFVGANARSIWTAPVKGDVVRVSLWTEQLELADCKLQLDGASGTKDESRVVETPTGEDLVLTAVFPAAVIRDGRELSACGARWTFDAAARQTLEELDRVRETGGQG